MATSAYDRAIEDINRLKNQGFARIQAEIVRINEVDLPSDKGNRALNCLRVIKTAQESLEKAYADLKKNFPQAQHDTLGQEIPVIVKAYQAKVSELEVYVADARMADVEDALLNSQLKNTVRQSPQSGVQYGSEDQFTKAVERLQKYEPTSDKAKYHHGTLSTKAKNLVELVALTKQINQAVANDPGGENQQAIREMKQRFDQLLQAAGHDNKRLLAPLNNMKKQVEADYRFYVARNDAVNKLVHMRSLTISAEVKLWHEDIPAASKRIAEARVQHKAIMQQTSRAMPLNHVGANNLMQRLHKISNELEATEKLLLELHEVEQEDLLSRDAPSKGVRDYLTQRYQDLSSRAAALQAQSTLNTALTTTIADRVNQSAAKAGARFAQQAESEKQSHAAVQSNVANSVRSSRSRSASSVSNAAPPLPPPPLPSTPRQARPPLPPPPLPSTPRSERRPLPPPPLPVNAKTKVETVQEPAPERAHHRRHKKRTHHASAQAESPNTILMEAASKNEYSSAPIGGNKQRVTQDNRKPLPITTPASVKRSEPQAGLTFKSAAANGLQKAQTTQQAQQQSNKTQQTTTAKEMPGIMPRGRS